jgi:antitoxin Phd
MTSRKKSAKRLSEVPLPPAVKDLRSRNEKFTIPATKAKNQFASLLETVLRGGHVVITKHSQPKAILISLDDFNTLSRGSQVTLDTLSDEFDALLAQMQTPEARAGMQAAMESTPKELGRAAVRALPKRG